ALSVCRPMNLRISWAMLKDFVSATDDILGSSQRSRTDFLRQVIQWRPANPTRRCREPNIASNFIEISAGGRKRNRTAVRGFAVLCITTLPSGPAGSRAYRRPMRPRSSTVAEDIRAVAGRLHAPYIGILKRH